MNTISREKTILQNQVLTNFGLVSIIMPNYNCAKYLKDTIDSVLAQTYTNWELLFVDDCSTDDSVSMIQSFHDDRIKVFQSKQNGGAAIARNYAIEAARGRWIAFLDSDDLWHPQKLEKQLEYMIQQDVSFCFTGYEVLGDDNKLISTYNPSNDQYDYKDILKHNHIGCLTVIYDSQKIGKVLMPTDAIKREDHACWLAILKQEISAYCLHECLAQYKVHSNSVSSSKLKMVKYQWNVYKKVEKLSFFKSVYYMAHWAILGVLKYR